MHRTTLRLAAASIGATLALGGCSFNASLGGASIKQADVENRISAEISTQTKKQNRVSCPGDLKGREGTTMECSATIETTTHPVAVTVDSVQGSHVHYSFQMDPTPRDTGGRRSFGTALTANNIDLPSAPTTPGSDDTDAPYPGSETDSAPTAGERTVSRLSLEVEVSDKVNAATGMSTVTTCPNTLPMRTGATTTCKVVDPDLGPLFVKVEVTEVVSDGVMFRVTPVQ